VYVSEGRLGIRMWSAGTKNVWHKQDSCIISIFRSKAKRRTSATTGAIRIERVGIFAGVFERPIEQVEVLFLVGDGTILRRIGDRTCLAERVYVGPD
jgi:hypothetical protein